MKALKHKTLTMWVIFAAVLLIFVYDAWAVMQKPKRSTVSKIVTLSSKKYLLIPFLLGLLMGHFFWSQHLNGLDN